MQRFPYFSRTLFVSALITLIAVGVYELLPEKRWDWIPGPDIVAHIYADEMHGGASQASWINEDNIHFSCELRAAGLSAPPFCGFHVHLDSPSTPNVDLSKYNRVLIDIDYTGGNEKLRFYLNEFVPGYSDPDDPVKTGTAKYLGAYVLVSETEGELVIQMAEFLVADWWVNNNNVPRHYSMPSRHHVLTFGVDVAFPSALGYHELKLNSVSFVGAWISAENWYLGIVLVWVATLVIAGITRIYYLRNLVRAEKSKQAKLRRYASELQQEKNKYQQLSTIDPLTRLLNRHGLSTYYENEIATGHSGWPVGMLLIDIDHFKPVNDTHGHNVGDLILRRIADSISGHSRQADKAARWGGEEFVVLLPKTSSRDALMLAERLRNSVMRLIHPEIPGQSVTVSIGIGELNENDSFDDAFKRADAALYHAKNSGRNRVVSESDLPNAS
jgi:diguanylate cyclase (GGDEF)-like protein